MNYVTTNNKRFSLNGQLWFPFGGTLYRYDNNKVLDNAYFDTIVPEIVALGLNHIRFINFFGAYAPTSETIWASIDYGLDKLATAGIKVNFSFAEYRASLEGQSINPYTYDWSTFLGFFLNRVNTVNGKTYKNDDTIFLISLDGEYNSTTYQWSDILNFITTYSAYVKTRTSALVDAGQLFTSQDYTTIWNLPNIDIRCITSYYNVINSQSLDQEQFFPIFKVQAINKPWYFAEFGSAGDDSSDQKQWSTILTSYKNALKNDCAGTCFWNFGNQPQPHTFDISTNRPYIYNLVKEFAGVSNYSPRLKVI
jgi:hypothetical protein